MNTETSLPAFTELGLSPAALEALNTLGYTTPTPVQAQAIPLVLAGRDIMAAAKTGTGKTAAFSLPALDLITRTDKRRSPTLLVVTPTRELAMQIEEVCIAIAKGRGLRVSCVVGGVKLEPQIERLAKGVDVLIATPGRLLDLMDQKAVNLSDVQILVLDEADRMLDMGFLPSVRRIVRATPSTRQTLLFSATIDQSVLSQVDEMLNDPAIVQIATRGETADTVEQYVVEVPHTLKADLLMALLTERGHRRVIVFTRTRHRADTVCRKLRRAGYKAEAIHSDRTQNQRKRALDNFAAGTTDILVATDVLARGIDVDDVAYVVNYDVPTQAEDYVHRIGRTGRAGAEGFAVTFVSPENAVELKAIEKLIKRNIPALEIAGFDTEQAAGEAAARANRANARRDPDIAEAVREQAKKKKRKAKAKARAVEAGEAPAKQQRQAKQPKVKPDSVSAEQRRKAAKRKQKSAAQSTTKRDMRPGRAHRAAMANESRRNHRG